jgi:hypothetical protein
LEIRGTSYVRDNVGFMGGGGILATVK